MSNKEQRIRRLKSAGKPPKPKLPGHSYSEESPKPAESTAKAKDQALAHFAWYPTYQAIKERFEWRKAAYIAWAASPKKGRVPALEDDMAQLLGYTAARTFRKWKKENPDIDAAIREMKLAPLEEHLADVITAWVDSALIVGRDGHADRKLFLERAGLLGESGALTEDEREWWEATEDKSA